MDKKSLSQEAVEEKDPAQGAIAEDEKDPNQKPKHAYPLGSRAWHIHLLPKDVKDLFYGPDYPFPNQLRMPG